MAAFRVQRSLSLFTKSTIRRLVAKSESAAPTSIFDFSVQNIAGESVSMQSFQGKKAYIVVNVACQWGKTETHYAQLVELYKRYASEGLEIIAFPCNTFLQERGSNAEILEFVKQRGVTFPVMGKLDCWYDPLFQYMAEKQPDSGFISAASGPGVKWNFNKYLCDGSGVPVKRFSPSTVPFDMEADILSLLQVEDSKK